MGISGKHPFQRTPDDGSVRHVPDSAAGFTLTQLRDLFFGPDWHPNDHPPTPDVAHVPTAGNQTCSLAGSVIGQTGQGDQKMHVSPDLHRRISYNRLEDFKSGARVTSVPKRNIGGMVKLSKAITEEEIAVDCGLLLQPQAEQNDRSH